MIVLSDADVAALLPMPSAIAVVDRVMRLVSRGGAQMPLRHVVPAGGPNLMGVMSGALSDPPCHGAKLISLFPGNPARGLSGHRGAVVVFEADTGTAVAMMDAGRLTALRTAAASAVATRALARPDASRLTLIGTGEQAEHHLTAICAVRPIRSVHVVGRRPEKAASLAAHAAALGLKASHGTDAQAGVRGADIVCTVTTSSEPVLQGDWLEPGQHLNIVGASVPTKREVDDAVILSSALWCDYTPSLMAQAGEVVAMQAAGILPAPMGEIGAVLDGTLPGRSSPDQITLYRSLGIIAQDLACAHHLWQVARARGLGQAVSL